MPEISTLFFIYGTENFQAEEIRKIESEFAEELQWLDILIETPDEWVINEILKEAGT